MQLREHFITHMTKTYKNQDAYDSSIAQKIQNEADKIDYAFRGLAFGGRKKKSRKNKYKPKQNKKTRRHKNHK